jgi:hypothetical protein
MNLKTTIFAVAFAAVSLASLDAQAAINEIEIVGDRIVVQQGQGRVDPVAAAPVPGLSNWAMMLAGFAGLGLAGYRRKPRSFAA